MLTFFTRTYDLTMDAKGRVPVPANYRKVLGAAGQDFVVLTLGPSDRCLRGYTNEGFMQVVQRLELVEDDALRVNLKRKLMSNLAELSFDVQGRVLVPAHLRQKANLVSECSFVGGGDYFEVWNKQDWEAEESLVKDRLDEHAGDLLKVFG